MKKIVLMVVAMFSLTMSFAENENANAAQSTNAYDMTVNIRRLAVALGLNNDQMEAVQDIHRNFCNEMMLASQADGDEREHMLDEAVRRDLRYMGYVLDKKQHDKYKLLLNTTLHNRGLK